jgi:hypothetical protein
MGFAVGGSVAWAIDQPNYQQHVSDPSPAADNGPDQNQPTKSLRQRLSVIWNRTWDDPVAFYTFVLSIFTALVAIISATQIVFLIRTDKLTRISVRAAQKSADALPAIERSYIFLRIENYHIQPKTIVSQGRASPPKSLSVRYTLINHGKTPAIVREIKVGIKCSTDDLSPQAWRELEAIRIPADVLASGEALKEGGLWVSDNEPFTDAFGVQLLKGTAFIYFFGHIAYQDVFGNERETQFCWRMAQKSFTEWGGEKHNYRT